MSSGFAVSVIFLKFACHTWVQHQNAIFLSIYIETMQKPLEMVYN